MKLSTKNVQQSIQTNSKLRSLPVHPSKMYIRQLCTRDNKNNKRSTTTLKENKYQSYKTKNIKISKLRTLPVLKQKYTYENFSTRTTKAQKHQNKKENTKTNLIRTYFTSVLFSKNKNTIKPYMSSQFIKKKNQKRNQIVPYTTTYNKSEQKSEYENISSKKKKKNKKRNTPSHNTIQKKKKKFNLGEKYIHNYIYIYM